MLPPGYPCQPIRSSRLAGYRDHKYECLVFLYRYRKVLTVHSLSNSLNACLSSALMVSGSGSSTRNLAHNWQAHNQVKIWKNIIGGWEWFLESIYLKSHWQMDVIVTRVTCVHQINIFTTYFLNLLKTLPSTLRTNTVKDLYFFMQNHILEQNSPSGKG